MRVNLNRNLTKVNTSGLSIEQDLEKILMFLRMSMKLLVASLKLSLLIVLMNLYLCIEMTVKTLLPMKEILIRRKL